MRGQELRESRGGRPGLSVQMSLMVSVDVKDQVYIVTYYLTCAHISNKGTRLVVLRLLLLPLLLDNCLMGKVLW